MRRQSHQPSPSLSVRSTGPSIVSPPADTNPSTATSTKAQRRTSILDSFHTAHIGNISSLGVLGELQEDLGDKVGDLTHRLAIKERECEKLQDQMDLLQNQLTSRPPRSEIEQLLREFKIQETLLSGFQRENEKASREIEKGKTRERLLESHLERLFGPTWAASLDIPTHPVSGSVQMASASASSSPIDSPTIRPALIQPVPSLSRVASGSATVHTPTHTAPSSVPPASTDSIPPATHTEGDISAGDGPQDILAQLQGFKQMMHSLERRIGQREGELQTVLSRAEEETRLWTSKQALYH